jgi:hypothetical protein
LGEIEESRGVRLRQACKDLELLAAPKLFGGILANDIEYQKIKMAQNGIQAVW